MKLKHASIGSNSHFDSILNIAPLRADLIGVAARDVDDFSIWKHYPNQIANRDQLVQNFENLIALQVSGQWLVHLFFTPHGEFIGQSCYLNIRASDCGVEIGGTWYRPKFQGTKVNPLAKLLLLENAFACGAKRVEFKTDILNGKSRAALLKLGAKFEGIFRNHMVRANGTMRDSAYFSIINSEWPEVKKALEARINS